METTNPHPAGSITVLTPEPSEIRARPRQELPDPNRAVAMAASERRLEALEQAWESEAPRFTAAECFTMPIQQLRRLCEEAFTALDSDFPAWGARDEYEVLSAELTIRAQALTNRTTSAPD